MRSILMGIFCLSNITAGLYAISEDDIVKAALEGYAESRKGNQDKAQVLFAKTLQSASKYNWPTYNESQRNKALQECIKKHRCDWQGTDEQKIWVNSTFSKEKCGI